MWLGLVGKGHSGMQCQFSTQAIFKNFTLPKKIFSPGYEGGDSPLPYRNWYM